jgi:cell division septation protein DedD
LHKASAALALRGLVPIVGISVKERLTGAIILVALIVLLVPELLTGPIRSAPRAMASAAGEPPLRSYTITLGDEAHSKPAEPQGASPAVSPAPVPLPTPAAASKDDNGVAGTQPAPDTAVAAAAPVPAPPAAHTRSEAPSPPAAHAAKPAAAGSAEASAAAGAAWLVQLGSFASRSNAERLAQQLKGQGFAASVSQGSSGRHLYRVRVGPVHDHGAATQLQAKLQAAGHSGSIVPK